MDSRYGRLPLDEYIHTAPVNGVIFVQHGRILYECYPRMRPFDKHLLMSVSKVFTALVIALLEARGQIDLRQAVERISARSQRRRLGNYSRRGCARHGLRD